ncbi:hypothetical protein IAR55_002885 [Kwoniella newhampshirensis]|uniref:Smr domain-containing protein n=1 Tax=Kwoniella newhampshirensis TaxID=1651941 RepID=A0AAW0YP90_9TREE
MEESIDPSALASVLAADHPLIDPPLIIALLSDYPPSSLPTHLPAIKEQLGILEATLVPDLDTNDDNGSTSSPAPESWTESISVSGSGVGIDDLAKRLESVTSLTSASEGAVSKEPKKRTGKGSTADTGRASNSGTGTGGTSEKSGTESKGSPSEADDGEGFDTELELLKSLFPAVPDDTIRTALSSEISLQAAIDHLLSLELIRDVEEHGYWPGEETALANGEAWDIAKPKKKSPPLPSAPRLEDSLLLSPSPLSRSSSVGSKSSRKARKKETRTIPLVDTLQRKATPVLSRPSSRSASVERSPSRGLATKSVTHGPSPNAWHTVSSLSSYLSELLPPHPANHFLSYLHAPAYHSAYTAIRASLVALPAKSKSNDTEAISRGVLEDVYGFTLEGGNRRDAEKDLEICVNVAGEDVATVMDLMDLLAEISHWPGDDDFFEERPEFAIPNGRSGRDSAGTTTPVGSPIVLPITKFAPPSPIPSALEPLPAPPTPTLPGKVVRKKKREPERKEAERVVPGSKPAQTAASHPTAMDAFGQASTPSSPRRKKVDAPQVHVQNWRTVSHARAAPRKNQSHVPTFYRGMISHEGSHEPGLDLASSSASSSLLLSGRSKTPGTTIEDCLAQAREERSKRESAIRAAGRSYRLAGQNARLAKGVVAGHYAEQARAAGQRAREWELQAARMVVDNQLNNSSSSHPSASGTTINGSGGRSRTIDLHHTTVNEATTLAQEACRSWWNVEKEKRAERWGTETNGHLVIVTGVGRHSVGNRGVLGPAVAGKLEKEGWKVERGDGERGYLVVWGRK